MSGRDDAEGRDDVGGRVRRIGRDLVVVLPALVAARVLVLAGYVLARAVVDRLDPDPVPVALGDGLVAWDGTWYRALALDGYDGSPIEAVRFFPLFPGLGRALGWVLGGRPAVALVVVANVAAVALAVLVLRLVRHERPDDESLAVRAVWCVTLFPAAFVLVWGYAESLMLVGVVGALLGARTRRWGWAAAAGVVAALARPVGGLVVVAVAIEGVRVWRDAGGPERARAAVAVVAPAVAGGAFVVWDGLRSGEWLRPYTIQGDFRGDEVDPLRRIWEGFGDLAGGERFGDGLHAPFAVLFVVLAVLTFRWWPASYGAFAVLVLVAALSAENLNSLERYGLNAVPLALTAARAVEAPAVERAALTVAAGAMVALAAMAWLGAYVP